MLRQGEVLVAILNRPQDFTIARDQHWYRIPVESVEKYLRPYWHPEWLAFYQPKAFGQDAYRIRYYAQVLTIETVLRQALFPAEPETDHSQKQYYKLTFSSLEELPEPIVSLRQRRITFIPTTLVQLMTALDVQDLFPSPQRRPHSSMPS